jgi:hypothetical protein
MRVELIELLVSNRRLRLAVTPERFSENKGRNHPASGLHSWHEAGEPDGKGRSRIKWFWKGTSARWQCRKINRLETFAGACFWKRQSSRPRPWVNEAEKGRTNSAHL